MFKAIKDNKIIAINDTEIKGGLVYDEMIEDKEHSVSDYLQVNGEFVLSSSDEAIEQKKVDVRAIRNGYLEKYVDPKQLVLVWDGLEEDKRQDYADYRRYLLDYPETEGWYEQNPMTFEQWKIHNESETKNEGGE